MYVCHVLIDQEPDNVQVQLPSQKLIHSKIARHQVLIKVTTWPVYLGELFVSEQKGVSNLQEESHQSQSILLLSSHCSQDHTFNVQFQHSHIHWLIAHDQSYQLAHLKSHVFSHGIVA